MAQFFTTSEAHGPQFRLYRSAAALASKFAAGWQARRAVLRLARLDDHLLSDIGIERSDIDWALGLPFWEDCQAALYRRVTGYSAGIGSSG